MPADHPDRIGTTNNLGWTLVLCGDLANARPYLERASSDAERIHGPRNPFTSTIVHSLGELELRAGRYDRPRSLLERALIASQAEGTDTPFSIDPLSSLGRRAEITRDLAGAESFFRRSLLLHEKLRGPQHPTLRDTTAAARQQAPVDRSDR